MSVIGSALPFFFGSKAAVFNFLDPTNIGKSVQGGFFAGLISYTANGVPTHALIVAPSATGYNGQVPMQWKTTNTTTAGTTSSFDGAANSANMNNASHPAAQYCEGLSIGGYTDWYLPARYELEIAYYNLKPTTEGNNTSYGINSYSVPARASNYTSGNPAQTTVVAFQVGGAEDFIDSANWSSTENNATSAFVLMFQDGRQLNYGKTDGTAYVRAFRKVSL